MAGKTCKICDTPSGMYPLCKNCFELKAEGYVDKCEECGNWFLKKYKNHTLCDACYFDNDNELDESISSIILEANKPENNQICPICESNSGDKKLCKNCWIELKNEIENITQKRTKEEIKNHFYNHSNYLRNLKTSEYLHYGLIKLLALANELEQFYSDTYLLEKAYAEIEKIISWHKKPNQENKESQLEISNDIFNAENEQSGIVFTEESEMDFRKLNPAEFRAKDGHYVRSTYEKILDDYLFDNKIFHCYEKKIPFGENVNECMICDFYLPENDIYIELWGNMDNKYIERKNKKIAKYDELKITLIQVEDSHTKIIDDIMDRNVLKYKIKKHIK